MKVIAYVSSVTDEAPEAYRCAARIVLGDGSLHPVVFHGPDKVVVRAKANAWWEEQLAAERRKAANRAAAASRRTSVSA